VTLMMLLFLLVALAAAAASASWAMGGLILTALIISAWRLWVPVTFDFSAKGITQTALGRQTRIAWWQVAGYKVYSRGVLLIAGEERALLPPLQGLYVQWGGAQPQLLKLLRHYLGGQSAPSGSTTESYRA
jgi:hypothetical protein